MNTESEPLRTTLARIEEASLCGKSFITYRAWEDNSVENALKKLGYTVERKEFIPMNIYERPYEKVWVSW